MKRKALGRGLSAILSNNNAPASPADSGAAAVVGTPSGTPQEPPSVPPSAPQPAFLGLSASDDSNRVYEIPVEYIRVNHMQPRTEFLEEEINELADSIRVQGVLQPLLVRVDPNLKHHFQLIAGERRLRASKQIPLKTVPCMILQASEAQMLEIALIENIQRSNLSPLEEARAYRLMSEQYHLTQEEIAQKVGKSRAAVANSMRLLNLPEATLSALESGLISFGHAKCMSNLLSPEEIDDVTTTIILKDLSVRDTEDYVRNLFKKRSKPQKPSSTTEPAPQDDGHIKDLERRLESNWNTKVQVKMSGKNKGRIEIQFYDLDHLDDLLKKWNVRMG